MSVATKKFGMQPEAIWQTWPDQTNNPEASAAKYLFWLSRAKRKNITFWRYFHVFWLKKNFYQLSKQIGKALYNP